VTVNTVAYIGLRPEETNNASALLNVFRNIGGSVGISVAQTLLANDTQTNQARLTEGLSQLNPVYTDSIRQIDLATGVLGAGQSYLYQQVAAQARFLAYLDVFGAIAVFMACCIPLFLLVRGGEAGTPSHGGIE